MVDCDQYYCSVESLFRVGIRGLPQIVLSNNDGCVISMNRQAKELGIPKFAPYFKIRELCNKNNVIVSSSNYALTVGKYFRHHML
ncbi:hypothetical protein [Vibrio gangliei]|uniref:Y-family DNA polymerase n=1 Tax=Vibrio gangliei TaxID=2077090 RepID=UPI002481ED61|nr:hypothetical protein [Vibrio gangliei]